MNIQRSRPPIQQTTPSTPPSSPVSTPTTNINSTIINSNKGKISLIKENLLVKQLRMSFGFDWVATVAGASVMKLWRIEPIR